MTRQKHVRTSSLWLVVALFGSVLVASVSQAVATDTSCVDSLEPCVEGSGWLQVDSSDGNLEVTYQCDAVAGPGSSSTRILPEIEEGCVIKRGAATIASAMGASAPGSYATTGDADVIPAGAGLLQVCWRVDTEHSTGTTAADSGCSSATSPADCSLEGYDDQCEEWLTAHDVDGSYDFTTDIDISPDGSRIFITGSSKLPQSNNNAMATIAFDAITGAKVWESLYSAGDDTRANSIVVSPGGERLYVSGFSGPASARKWESLAYDAATGEQLWVAAFDVADWFDEVLDSVVGPGPEGSERVYLAGRRAGFHVAALDGASGELQWEATDVSTGKSRSIGLSPDGAYVYAMGPISVSSTDIKTVAYDSGLHDTEEEQHGGELLWSATYDGPAGGTEFPLTLKVGPEGSRLFVAGYECAESVLGGVLGLVGSCDYDFVTLAYAADTGQQLWKRAFKGAEGFESLDVLADGEVGDAAVSPDGAQVFVTVTSIDVGRSATTLAYDAATGQELWVMLYPASRPQSIAVNPEGSAVYVSGGDPSAQMGIGDETAFTGDGFVVAYSTATGQQLWAARNNCEANDCTWTEQIVCPCGGLEVSSGGDKLYMARTFAYNIELRTYALNQGNTHDFGVVAYDTEPSS